MFAISLLIGFSLAKLPHIYPKYDFFCDGSERCERRASSSDGLNNLKIENADFSDYDDYTIREGGAVYCSDLNLDVDGCTFTNCQACDNGGAIYAKVGNAGSQQWEYAYIQISNSSFNECGTSLLKNGGRGGGGALFLMGSVENRPITVYNCHFSGIFFPESNYYDKFNLPDMKETGGAICMSTPEGKVEKCTFHPNSDSKGLGNCVAFFQSPNTQKCNFEIFDCKFYLDTYLNNAMIYIDKVEGDMQINKCTFIKKDGDFGTYLIDSFTDVKVGQNTRFSKGLEDYVIHEERKEKYHTDGTVVFEDIIDDQDNTPSEEAPTDDPPTENPPTQEAPTENPTTADPEPTFDGIICGETNRFVNGDNSYNFQIEGCTFNNLDDTAIYLIKYGIECRNCQFYNCKSQPNDDGGGVYIYCADKVINDIFLKFEGCEFKGCIAENGGGLYIFSSRKEYKPEIIHCLFTDNVATYSTSSSESTGGNGGGGLNIQCATCMISQCIFSGNSGIGGNALIDFTPNKEDDFVLIQGCTFTHSGSSKSRSSVYIFDTGGIKKEGQTFTFQSCRFDGEIDENSYQIDHAGKTEKAFLHFKDCYICSGETHAFQGNLKDIVLTEQIIYDCNEYSSEEPTPDHSIQPTEESSTDTQSTPDHSNPPTEEPYTEEPPTKEPHTEEPHTEEPPTKEPHTEEPHTEEPPTKEPHTEEPPTKEPHTEEPPTKEPPTKEPHTEEPPTKEPHTEEPPTKEPPTKEPPTKEPHTEEPHTEEPPTKEPPTKEPHTEEPPTKEPHTEEPPTKEPPTKEPHTKVPHTEEPPTKVPHTEEQPTPDIVTEQPIDYVCESGKRCSFPPGTLSTTTTITIVKSLFEEISNTDDNIDDGNGGAIYLVNYDVICMNNTFTKCTCINHGGAMYIEVSLPESAKPMNAQISQSNFSKNKAHSGSAVYIKSGHKSRSFSLQGNRFESNEITSSSSSSSFSTILEESSSPVGGCVFIDGFGGTISNLVFSGNKGKGADLTILLSHNIEDTASTEIHECNFNFVGNKDSPSSVYVIMNVDGPINLQFINCSFNGTLTEDSHFFEFDKSVNKQGKIFLNDVYLCDFTDISAFGENYTDYIDNNSVIYYTCDNLPTWNPDPNPDGNTEEGLSTGAKVAIGIIVPIVIIAVIIVIVIFVFKKNNTENVENPTSELSETANGSTSDFMSSMNSQDNPMYVGDPLSTNIIDEENDPFKQEIEDSSSSNQLV